MTLIIDQSTSNRGMNINFHSSSLITKCVKSLSPIKTNPLQWPISERNSAPSAACWIAFIILWSWRMVIFLFQEAVSAGSVGCWMCQRVLNFPQPLFISQSQGCLQKVLVRGWGMFVKQFSSLLCRRVLKMHKGAEFSTLCACACMRYEVETSRGNFFASFNADDQSNSYVSNVSNHWTISVHKSEVVPPPCRRSGDRIAG